MLVYPYKFSSNLWISAIPSVEETQTKPEKTEHSKTKSEKDIIHGARCILLAIQNDSSLKKRFITTLDEKAMEINQKIVKMGYPKSSIEAIRARPAEAAFLTMIHEFQQYAVYNIKIPFQVWNTLSIINILQQRSIKKKNWWKELNKQSTDL